MAPVERLGPRTPWYAVSRTRSQPMAHPENCRSSFIFRAGLIRRFGIRFVMHGVRAGRSICSGSHDAGGIRVPSRGLPDGDRERDT